MKVHQLFQTSLYLLLIVVAAFVLYLPTLSYDFVLDDKVVISENDFVKNGTAGIPDIFNNDSFTGYFGHQQTLLSGGRYRPLSLIVFAIEYQIFGLDTSIFHLFNIIFYAISCMLLYFVLTELFKTKVKSGNTLKLLSFVTSLIFVIHPVHTEVVANIKGLDEILSLLFSLTALYFFLKDKAKNKFLNISLGLASMLLALLSKENSLAFVFIIPFSLYFFRKDSLTDSLKAGAVLLIPVFIYFVFRYNALGFLLSSGIKESGIMNDPYIDVSFMDKISTIFYTLLLYIKLIFYPNPLTHDYYPYQISIEGPLAIRSIISFAIIISLTVYSFLKLKTKKLSSYLILFFLASIFLMSNIIVNVGTFMNERFIFTASMVLPILIIYLLNKTFELKYRQQIIYSATAALLLLSLVYYYLSYKRIPAWENTKTLNTAAVKVSKNSARANCFMGVWMYNDLIKVDNLDEKAKLIKDAKVYIDKSLEIFPEYKDALVMKAGLATSQYKVDKDMESLLQTFKEILLKRHIDYVDEYLDWLIPRAPKNRMTTFLFDCGYNIMAKKKKDYKPALNYLSKAYSLSPNDERVLFGLTIVNYLMKNYSEAISYGEKFIVLNNKNADIYYKLGLSYNFTGKFDKAQLYLNKAYALNPKLKNK